VICSSLICSNRIALSIWCVEHCFCFRHCGRIVSECDYTARCELTPRFRWGCTEFDRQSGQSSLEKGSHQADFVHASMAGFILLNRSNCPTAPWKHIKQQWRPVRQSRTATSLQTQQLNHKLQNMLTCSHWLTTQQKHEDATFLAVLRSCHLMKDSQCLHSWTSFHGQCP